MAYEICIYCNDDGSFAVSKEPIEMNEEQGEPKGTPAKSFSEALQMAESLFNQESGGDFESSFNEFADA